MEQWPHGLTPAIVAAAFLLFAWLERRRPLRTATRSKGRRVARNLATGALAAAVVVPLQTLLAAPLLAQVEARRLGLLHQFALPSWLEVALAVVLLDWSLWLWHRANHGIPFLWRFHLVHHVDPELDASTALRFHFGELGLSALVRIVQVGAIGAPPLAVALWSAALFVSILFHHSNWRLPLAVERRLVRVVVTPRMHGIHHSTVRSERDTNYSSLLSIWDRLHGTLLLAVPQRLVTIGVPQLLDEADDRLGRITLLPFGPDAHAGLADLAVAETPPRVAGPSRVLAE